ncbi:hypothetical protein TTHERM_00317040 (macronuclear) [Tetrahymena thermophila SB210]|uniref:Uncharacterized protein n=1 Tax=Tetrahymena thermophila (strain SB210) TaxID=312017 RepID=I7M2R2_TETTS|nr:hypothetical protein TTHERM_00317040 [Tetrahymena thermophila SB210]EAS01140.2 hypothetical protein TTHERM_00317040 [Tetrahymena thermophila SB210]|eukprot:XP_001021385.2 hypothetical protein TTHERM_00317040 [Tetrahymena thermophila SB210]
MSCSARSSIQQNMEDSQINSFAKKYTFEEQNQIHTSETCSSNNSPNDSCSSRRDQAKSVFNIEDYLVSTNKNQSSKDDFSSALAATIASESNATLEQLSFSQFPLTASSSIFYNSFYEQNSLANLPLTPATKRSSLKKPLARKSVFLEDQFCEKIEKKVKGNDVQDSQPIHEVVEFCTNDGSKTFKFNCFPERLLSIPAEFQDKNINHNSDNDAESSDETIQSACRYNLRKLKLELMELSTTFRYSHYHVDFDKVSSQYIEKKQKKEQEIQSGDTSQPEIMTQQQFIQCQQDEQKQQSENTVLQQNNENSQSLLIQQ